MRNPCRNQAGSSREERFRLWRVYFRTRLGSPWKPRRRSHGRRVEFNRLASALRGDAATRPPSTISSFPHTLRSRCRHLPRSPPSGCGADIGTATFPVEARSPSGAAGQHPAHEFNGTALHELCALAAQPVEGLFRVLRHNGSETGTGRTIGQVINLRDDVFLRPRMSFRHVNDPPDQRVLQG